VQPNVGQCAEVSRLPVVILQQKCGSKRAQYQGPSPEKDIRTKDKHKFSSPWEGSFIIVDIVALWAYVLAEVDGGMLPNMRNADQLRKYYA
jgi:hypothetical protein